MKSKNRTSDVALIRKFSVELRRLRREEARLARCLQRFEDSSGWTLTFVEAARVLDCTAKEIARLARDQTVWGRRLRALAGHRMPRSELRRCIEEMQLDLREDFVHRVQRIVLPGFSPVRWRMDHSDLSTTEAARSLRIGPRQVVDLINHGPLYAFRSWGGHFKISPHELEEFKKAHSDLISSAEGAA